MTYPRIENLPLQVDASDWTWSRTEERDFWIGHELDGTKWLVKGRGSFYALRERASAYLLQTLGINSQSSAFMILPEGSLPVVDKPEKRHQLAIRFIEKCGMNCMDGENRIDSVKLNVLACLCGANEPSEILISEDHIIYVIDNEQMFQDPYPSDPITCADWSEIEYDDMMELTLDLCRKLSVIDDRDIQVFTAIPDGYIVNEKWSISERMKLTVNFAKQFLKEYDGII